MNLQAKSTHLPHLSLGDVVVFKVLLSMAFLAVFVVPHPWNIPMGVASNLVWLWRL